MRPLHHVIAHIVKAQVVSQADADALYKVAEGMFGPAGIAPQQLQQQVADQGDEDLGSYRVPQFGVV